MEKRRSSLGRGRISIGRLSDLHTSTVENGMSTFLFFFELHLYRAMLCIRGTSHGPVSVCPSQVRVLLIRLNESSWFLACELPSTRPTLCCKEIRLSPKIRGLPSGTLS